MIMAEEVHVVVVVGGQIPTVLDTRDARHLCYPSQVVCCKVAIVV